MHTVEQPQAGATAPAPAIWRGTFGRLTLGLLLVISAAAYETLAVATILPDTAAELGGLHLYGWAFSAFMLANLFGVVLTGWAADALGVTPPFLAGVSLFVAGLLLAGFAPSMEILIAARAVQGFGAGFISSVAYAVIARAYPESMRPRMLALTSSAWVVPGLLGPALAGLIGEGIGWRWVFLSVVPLPPLALLFVLPALRPLGPTGVQAGAQASVRTRLLAAAALTAGTAAFTAGLGLGLRLEGLALAVGGAALAIPALQRLTPAGTLRAAAGLPAAIALMGLLNLVFFGVDAFVPLALSTVRGQTAAFTGLALTAGTLAWTAGAWMQAHWARTVRRDLLVGAGLLVLAVGIAAMIVVVFPWAPVWLGLVAWGVAGLGIGLAYGTLALTVLDEAPEGQQGASTAAMQLTTMLGTALGTGLGGVVVAGAATPAAGIQIHSVAMIVVALLTALLALRLGKGRV